MKSKHRQGMWCLAAYHKRNTLKDPQKEWVRTSEEVRDDREVEGNLTEDGADGVEASPGYLHVRAPALALNALLQCKAIELQDLWMEGVNGKDHSCPLKVYCNENHLIFLEN